MKNILCFGDSNTWGYNPELKLRYDRSTRWTGILQKLLGTDYYIIEEGLNGRTTVWDDPIEEGRCGKQYLSPCLISHKPLDLVVLMLGTNDLKKRFDVSVDDIARGLDLLVEKIQKSGTGREDSAPDILLLSPAVIQETGEFSEMFSGGEKKSKQFSTKLKATAEARGCRFFDTAEIMKVSDIDGIHFSAEAHMALAGALERIIKEIFE